MRKITTADIKWSISIEPETIALKGNVFADGGGAGSDWAWCEVRVTGEYHGLSETECLGECSYKNEAEFRVGGYYADIQNKILAVIQLNVDAIVADDISANKN